MSESQGELPFEWEGNQFYEPLSDPLAAVAAATARGWIPPGQPLPHCDGCGWSFLTQARQTGRGLLVMTLDRQTWGWFCPGCRPDPAQRA